MGKANGKSFDKLLRDVQQPLYQGCNKFAKLDFLVKLLPLKIINRLSNKAFKFNIQLIKLVLPEGEPLPNS